MPLIQHSGELWTNTKISLMILEYPWWSLIIPEDLWWSLMIPEDLWWSLIILGDSSMILDDPMIVNNSPRSSMRLNDFKQYLMILNNSWWSSMILDDPPWLLMILHDSAPQQLLTTTWLVGDMPTTFFFW